MGIARKINLYKLDNAELIDLPVGGGSIFGAHEKYGKTIMRRRTLLKGTMAAMAAFPLAGIKAGAAGVPNQLRVKEGRARFLDNQEIETVVWGYNGLVPGPIIRGRKGEEIVVQVANDLAQPTTIHWHGIRIDNAMDGVAGLTQEPIPPGERFTYRFSVPDAGTYWYHPHNRTWEQLARGLYGPLIIDGDVDPGEIDRDHIIVADDWRLAASGAIDENTFGNLHDWSHDGRLGNVLTLNGKHLERLPVRPGERVRVRLINTANARTLQLGIHQQDAWLVALDGQPISPLEVGNEGVMLAPAQRADLVFDVTGSPGDQIPIVELSGGEALVAGYFNCGEAVSGPDRKTVPKLADNAIPAPDRKAAELHELIMTGGAMRFLTRATYRGELLDGRNLARQHGQVWAFNGQAGMDDTPLFSVARGTTVQLKIDNQTAWPHAIHLHGHHFQVLERKPGRGRAQMPGSTDDTGTFRDTVFTAPDEVVDIGFVADNPGKWMLHCHMLEHQAGGMGTWVEVT